MSNTEIQEEIPKEEINDQKAQEGEIKREEENQVKVEEEIPVSRGSDEELRSVYSEFQIAISNGNVNQLKDILEKYNKIYDLVNKLDPQSRQISTFLAADYPDDQISFEMMKLLFHYGANANFKDHINQSVLFYVARDGKIQCFDLLMEKNIEVNDADNSGQTAIFFASRDNRIEIIRKMIPYGVNCYKVDTLCSQTPLFYAAREGHVQVIKLLIENGCQPQHLDATKKTAIHFARQSNQKEAIDILNYYITKSKEESKIDKEPSNGGQQASGSMLVKRKGQEASVKNSYQLIYTDDKGVSKELTEQEFEKEFQQQYPNIAKMLLDPDETITQEMIINAQTQEQWQKAAQKIVSSLWKVQGCNLFHTAVDPQQYGIEDYFDIVKKPMDLGTVKSRLYSNIYLKAKDFESDMDLIFSNCILYNGSQSEVGQTSILIRKEWENLKNQTGFGQFTAPEEKQD